MLVKGRDLINGVSRELEISQADIAGALSDLVGQIVSTVLGMLARLEPELAADLHERGIVMTGGGSLLREIDQALSAATGLQVSIAQDPLSCVAMGAGRAMEDAIYNGVMADG